MQPAAFNVDTRRRRALCALVLGSAVCSSAVAAQSAPATTRVDPKIILAVTEFQSVWQAAWIQSEAVRAQERPEEHKDRRLYYLCHAYLFFDQAGPIARAQAYGRGGTGYPESHYSMLRSRRHPAFGTCPTWLLFDMPPFTEDESNELDGALLPGNRRHVRALRGALIDTLAEAYHADSANGWVAGQLARFLVDNRRFADAHRALARCGANAWWCAALRGYVFAREGAVASAELDFARMRKQMPAEVGCEWADASNLLADAARQFYSTLSCAQRDSVNARLWWLSTPLYRSGSNHRYVEQERRNVDIALRKAVYQDERYAYDDERGGDAMSMLLSRYGWPTYAAWAGRVNDRAHAAYFIDNFRSAPRPPHSTYEYSAGRMTALPTLRALRDPFAAVSQDWSIGREDKYGNPSTDWWPQEHFRPARRMVQLPDGQLFPVRRQDHTELALAIQLLHPVMSKEKTDYDVMLLSTTGPTQVDSIDQHMAAGNSTVMLRGVVRHSPALLAVEAVGSAAATVDARTRFGYTAPPPLSALAPGEIALSPIALLSSLEGTQLQRPSDELLQFMRPSTTIPHGKRKVALYWEHYGVTPADSAAVVLRVASESTVGLLRRVGIAAGLTADPNSFVQLRWDDSAVPGARTTLQGPVPVQMHALQVDLGTLKAGSYNIELIVTTKDGRVATSRVPVELQR